jgi:hypothetical protein
VPRKHPWHPFLLQTVTAAGFRGKSASILKSLIAVLGASPPGLLAEPVSLAEPTGRGTSLGAQETSLTPLLAADCDCNGISWKNRFHFEILNRGSGGYVPRSPRGTGFPRGTDGARNGRDAETVWVPKKHPWHPFFLRTVTATGFRGKTASILWLGLCS